MSSWLGVYEHGQTWLRNFPVWRMLALKWLFLPTTPKEFWIANVFMLFMLMDLHAHRWGCVLRYQWLKCNYLFEISKVRSCLPLNTTVVLLESMRRIRRVQPVIILVGGSADNRLSVATCLPVHEHKFILLIPWILYFLCLILRLGLEYSEFSPCYFHGYSICICQWVTMYSQSSKRSIRRV